MNDAPRELVRLQKYLSDAGVASRRHAEQMIEEGRVLVNDRIVSTLPAFVDPSRDRVVADGAVVKPRKPVYFLLHKPRGVLCTNRDPSGRTRAVDLLPPEMQFLFPVGRLDAESSGLLLMTNDGELAQRISHPRFGIPKVYRAAVRGRVPATLPGQMKAGVWLAEGKARASDVRIVHAGDRESVLAITLREGRNRQVRRMLARLGHPVKDLKRIQIGPLSIKGLAVGAARRLIDREIAMLQRALARTTSAESRARNGPARVGRVGTPKGRPRGGFSARPPQAATAPRAPTRMPPRRRVVT
jgi:23S rRNA pseudouridine2605 synthase